MTDLPEVKTQEFGKINGIGKVYRVIGLPFDESLEFLKKYNAEPISLRDLAYARIQTGKYSDISENEFSVKEGAICACDKILLFSRSPLLDSTKQEIDAELWGHSSIPEEYGKRGALLKQGVKTLYFNKNQLEEYLGQAEQDKNKEPQKRKVLISKTNKNYEIPTNRFNNEELTLWAFKDKAKEYGLFLRDAGIDKMPIKLAKDGKKVSKSPVRQLSLEGLFNKIQYGEGAKEQSANSCLHNIACEAMIGAYDWHDYNYFLPFGGVSKLK